MDSDRGGNAPVITTLQIKVGSGHLCGEDLVQPDDCWG
jgi:hypothetical protein